MCQNLVCQTLVLPIIQITTHTAQVPITASIKSVQLASTTPYCELKIYGKIILHDFCNIGI